MFFWVIGIFFVLNRSPVIIIKLHLLAKSLVILTNFDYEQYTDWEIKGTKLLSQRYINFSESYNNLINVIIALIILYFSFESNIEVSSLVEVSNFSVSSSLSNIRGKKLLFISSKTSLDIKFTMFWYIEGMLTSFQSSFSIISCNSCSFFEKK